MISVSTSPHETWMVYYWPSLLMFHLLMKLKGPQGQVTSTTFPKVTLTRLNVRAVFSSVIKPYSEMRAGGHTLNQILILSIWLAYFVFGMM